MKTTLFILLLLHGLIHVMGFAQAYQRLPAGTFQQPISKPVGWAWFAACIMTLCTVIGWYTGLHFAALGLTVTAAVSQLLILRNRTDAKWGSLGNLLMLLAAWASDTWW
jgi:hypothetical protein